MHKSNPSDYKFAELNSQQLSRLQGVENELNSQGKAANEIILLAYKENQ